MGNKEPEPGEQTMEENPEASVATGLNIGCELSEPPDVCTVKIRVVPDQVRVLPGHVIDGLAASVIVTVKTHDLERLALSKVMH